MAKITLNGYMTEVQAKALKNLMEGESYMNFRLDYFGYCGNCAVTVETKNVNVSEDELRNFFDYCVRVRLVQEAAEKKPVITVQDNSKPAKIAKKETEPVQKKDNNTIRDKTSSPYTRESVMNFFNTHTGKRYNEAKKLYLNKSMEPSKRISKKGIHLPKGHIYGLKMLRCEYGDVYAEIGNVEKDATVWDKFNDMMKRGASRTVMARTLNMSYYQIDGMIKDYYKNN